MHYFPIALPFLLLLFLLAILLFAMIEVGVLSYAYQKMGINRRHVFSLLLMSLLGSYINIPVFELPPEQIVSGAQINFYGIPYVIPVVKEWPGTIIALNIGGALIPTILSVYLTVKNGLYGRALLGVAVVTTLVHSMAYPIRGVGIAEPIFMPPIAATIAALVLSREYAPALAYISGTMGSLIGADLLNLDKIQGLGAPVASIGGAGTFDGVFMTGILAVLLASLMPGKHKVEKKISATPS
jgi:uncharacterized membrane protein